MLRLNNGSATKYSHQGPSCCALNAAEAVRIIFTRRAERHIGFERRVTIAFVAAVDAVLTEGIFYGGQDVEAAMRN